jgi:hypothetical protein
LKVIKLVACLLPQLKLINATIVIGYNDTSLVTDGNVAGNNDIAKYVAITAKSVAMPAMPAMVAISMTITTKYIFLLVQVSKEVFGIVEQLRSSQVFNN